MNKYIKFDGDEDALLAKLYEEGLRDKEAAKRFLSFLENNKGLLSDPNEYITKEQEYPSMPNGVLGMVMVNYSYHISIKVTTIVIIAKLLGIVIPKGIADTFLELTGMNTQAIAWLNEYEGEKCIVKETLLRDKKAGDCKLLRDFNGECVNNNMKCRYKEAGQCRCDEKTIISIYERLVEKNVFVRTGKETYAYQW